MESRLSIGEIPMLIIDGLNQQVSGWSILVEQLRTKPIKIIVTTREEDWVRYNVDSSRINTNTVEIKLTQSEAKDVFDSLNKHSRVHSSIETWQPAWEKIKDRGLLIEFVYLVTKGQMIEERLNFQVKNITNDIDAAAKLEILRLIALADLLNIRLKTVNLTNYIQENFHLQTDRNEIYSQLEKEYYLKFDRLQIEGLHPVRSKHLVDILHTNLPIEDSLTHLLGIIDTEFIYDYFITTPLIWELPDSFYKSAAETMAKEKFSSMVYAIDGLMHSEPQKFLETNKSIFDQARQLGGFMLFISNAQPFTQLRTIENLLESHPDNDNLRYLLKLQSELKPYNFESSLLYKFVKHLHSSLCKREPMQNVEGVNFLYKWFKKTNLEFPDIVPVQEDVLIDYLEKKEIGESAELFHYFSLRKPNEYKIFIERNWNTVISWIKRKTNTLSIYERDSDIHIEYLLDHNHANKTYEFSAHRIEILRFFFPNYSHYCTDVIILPFPNEDIYNAVASNAHKTIPPKNLFDEFDVHINQIWTKTINDNYRADSSFEWQKEHHDFRLDSLEVAKKCTRLFECVIEKNTSRYKQTLTELIDMIEAWKQREILLKEFPTESKKYFETKTFSEQQKLFSDWSSSFRNFLNQIAGIFGTVEYDARLAIINLKSAEYQLQKMQEAFDEISSSTYPYFDTTELKQEEQKWLERLSHTAQYLRHRLTNNAFDNIAFAKDAVVSWWESKKATELKLLHSIISSYERESGIRFYYPNKIVEEENICYTVIGIENIDWTNYNSLFDLATGLVDLLQTGIHFFTLLSINRKRQAVGGIRVSSEFFEKIKTFMETEKFEQTDLGNPFPVNPDEEMVAYLDGICLKKAEPIKAEKAYFQMMFNVWKLLEYRARLNENEIERKWLVEIEHQYSTLIRSDMTIVYNNNTHLYFPEQELIEQFLLGKVRISKEEVVSFMSETVTILNSPEKTAE